MYWQFLTFFSPHPPPLLLLLLPSAVSCSVFFPWALSKPLVPSLLSHVCWGRKCISSPSTPEIISRSKLLLWTQTESSWKCVVLYRITELQNNFQFSIFKITLSRLSLDGPKIIASLHFLLFSVSCWQLFPAITTINYMIAEFCFLSFAAFDELSDRKLSKLPGKNALSDRKLVWFWLRLEPCSFFPFIRISEIFFPVMTALLVFHLQVIRKTPSTMSNSCYSKLSFWQKGF